MNFNKLRQDFCLKVYQNNSHKLSVKSLFNNSNKYISSFTNNTRLFKLIKKNPLNKGFLYNSNTLKHFSNKISNPYDLDDVFSNVDSNIENSLLNNFLATKEKLSSTLQKEKEEIPDISEINYNRNFKNLVVDCYTSAKFINKCFNKSTINDLTDIFVQNIIKTKDVELNENLVITKFENYLLQSLDKASNLSEEEKNTKKTEISLFSKKTYESLVVIYEFIDRGMRGFLSGDISLSLISNLETIIDQKLKILKKKEQELKILGIDSNDFYEVFFKIDNHFFENNSSKSLVVNLSQTLEKEGVYKKVLLYYVNLKHTQLCNNLKTNYAKINKVENISDEEIKNILDESKKFIQQVFNDLYNEVSNASIFNKLKTPFNGIPYPQNESQSNLFRRQILIEENSFEQASTNFSRNFAQLQKLEKAHELFFNRKLLLNWQQNLVFSITEAQKSIIQKPSKLYKNNSYLKYVISLKPDEIAMICIHHLMKIIINNLTLTDKEEDQDLKLLNAIKSNTIDEYDISDEFELSIPLVSFAEEIGDLFFTELRNTKIHNALEGERAKFFYKHVSHGMIHFEVDKKDKIKLGLFLSNIIVRNLHYISNTEEQPVLKLIQKQVDTVKFQNFINISKDFMIKYYNDIQKTFSQTIQVSKSLPMLYPPMPWKCTRIGGYYLRNTNFSKIYFQNKDAMNVYDNSDVSRVMRILDYQSNVGWKINKRVLDVVEYIWASGGGIAAIPERFNKKLINKENLKAATFNEKLELLREIQQNRDNHSLRSDFLIKLRIAQDFSKVNEFYFPHNIDYRGRTYPISPHLNHIGNDFSRGLLSYSEYKPLGKNGLRWLKIHLANVMGKDKLTLPNREAYVDSIIDIVHKVADNPYNNIEWQEADNPWQALAAIFEVSAALKVSFNN